MSEGTYLGIAAQNRISCIYQHSNDIQVSDQKQSQWKCISGAQGTFLQRSDRCRSQKRDVYFRESTMFYIKVLDRCISALAFTAAMLRPTMG